MNAMINENVQEADLDNLDSANASNLTLDTIQNNMQISPSDKTITLESGLGQELSQILQDDNFRDKGGALWEDMSMLLLRSGHIPGVDIKNYTNLNADMSSFTDTGTIKDSPGADIVDLDTWNNASECVKVEKPSEAPNNVIIKVKASLLSAKSSAAKGSFSTGALACLKLAGLAIQKHKTKSPKDANKALIPQGTGLDSFSQMIFDNLNFKDEIHLHLGYLGLKYKPVIGDKDGNPMPKEDISIPQVGAGQSAIVGSTTITDAVKSFISLYDASPDMNVYNAALSERKYIAHWFKFIFYAYLKTLQNYVTAAAIRKRGIEASSSKELIEASTIESNITEALKLFKYYVTLHQIALDADDKTRLSVLIDILLSIDATQFINLNEHMKTLKPNKFNIRQNNVNVPVVDAGVTIKDSFEIHYASDEDNIMRIKRGADGTNELYISWNKTIQVTGASGFSGHSIIGTPAPDGEQAIVSSANQFNKLVIPFEVGFERDLGVPVAAASKFQDIVDGLNYQINFKLYNQSNFNIDTGPMQLGASRGRATEIDIEGSSTDANPDASTSISKKALQSISAGGLITGSGISNLAGISASLSHLTENQSLILKAYSTFSVRVGSLPTNTVQTQQLLKISSEISSILGRFTSGSSSMEELSAAAKILEAEMNKSILRSNVEEAIRSLMPALIVFSKDQDRVDALIAKVDPEALERGSYLSRQASAAGAPMPVTKSMDPISVIGASFGIDRSIMIKVLNAVLAEAGFSEGDIQFNENFDLSSNQYKAIADTITQLALLGLIQHILIAIGSDYAVAFKEIEFDDSKEIKNKVLDIEVEVPNEATEETLYESVINQLLKLTK